MFVRSSLRWPIHQATLAGTFGRLRQKVPPPQIGSTNRSPSGPKHLAALASPGSAVAPSGASPLPRKRTITRRTDVVLPGPDKSCATYNCYGRPLVLPARRTIVRASHGCPPRRVVKRTSRERECGQRRGGRVVEGARLESVYAGNRIAGSNPAPSATLIA